MALGFVLKKCLISLLSSSRQQQHQQLATSNFEAQRLNRAVLSYDFIYLLIAIAATLLFVFETLYRVYNLYATNGRSLSRKKRQLGNNARSQHMLFQQDENADEFRIMQLLDAAPQQWKSV